MLPGLKFFQVWITLHIWFPRSNRLASTDQIFGTPSYSGLLTELSFMLNRRSDSGRLKFRYDLYWARNKCLQNVISTTQAGLGRLV